MYQDFSKLGIKYYLSEELVNLTSTFKVWAQARKNLPFGLETYLTLAGVFHLFYSCLNLARLFKLVSRKDFCM